MRELRTSGSVGALGRQLPTRPVEPGLNAGVVTLGGGRHSGTRRETDKQLGEPRVLFVGIIRFFR